MQANLAAVESNDLGQLRQGRVPGNKGIWVGICCEFVEFLVLFAVYFVARAHFPEAFEQGAERLSRTAGTLITLIMVSSSFCIACSVATIRAGQRRSSILWLLAGLLLALAYPATKLAEIQWNLAHGIGGQAGIFFTVYYYLTFNHMVHAFSLAVTSIGTAPSAASSGPVTGRFAYSKFVVQVQPSCVDLTVYTAFATTLLPTF